MKNIENMMINNLLSYDDLKHFTVYQFDNKKRYGEKKMVVM